MTRARRVPPGRAGRLRLRHNLEVALRGADLLERKLRILRGRQQSLQETEESARRAWLELLAEAETWLLRGLVMSGEGALEASAVADRADVTVEWTTSMGVLHPAGVVWTPAVRSPDESAPGNTALARAEAAYREAVRAAAEYAAARTASRLVGAEAERTRQRTRALRRHWIPRLTEELAAADLALEQSEHEDLIRRRWAASVSDRPTTP
ncbi:V-type ATP synthase subunit D [Streptomyces sp. NPDC023998]|uniref:V-type ATP synthase subunit D n=1 Tax=Streptomyces sp. NPDC023998 TaxID=3154597 RepID=UPI0033F430A4